MIAQFNYRTTLLVLVLAGDSLADPPLQPQVSLTAGASDTWNADWQGVSQCTYFSLGSVNLTSWVYAPVIEFADGIKSIGFDTNHAPKFFFRLKSTDMPTIEPEIEDFDSDQIGNLAEIMIGHDPFVAEPFVDTDGDGISDAIETHWYQNLTTMNATSDSDGDGIPDLIEAQAGADPTADQSAETAKRTDYQYDAMGRLTDADDDSYAFDIEGNLESAN